MASLASLEKGLSFNTNVNSCNVDADNKEIFSNKPDLTVSISVLLSGEKPRFHQSKLNVPYRANIMIDAHHITPLDRIVVDFII